MEHLWNMMSAKFLHSLIHWFLGSLIQWFIDSLIHWLAEPLIHWVVVSLIDRFIGSLVAWFIESLLCCFIDSLIHWLTDSLIHWFIGSSVHWFVHSVVHGFFHVMSLASQQPFAHSFMHLTTSTLHRQLISSSHSNFPNFRPGAGRALPGVHIHISLRIIISDGCLSYQAAWVPGSLTTPICHAWLHFPERK